jgi:hypothetical protein
MKQFTVLSPTAILGYGFPESSFMEGIAQKPDLIAVDGGSTDPGPYYLGKGISFTNRLGVKRDLRFMLTEGVKRKIPVVVGTAGGAGAKTHLEWCRQIVLEIAREEGLSFRLGTITADIEKEKVLSELEGGRISSLDGFVELEAGTVKESGAIVAQMGIEPIIRAHKAECDVILCGRAYDPAVFAALPIMRGFDPGLALHMGKILECAAIAATPGSGSDSVLGILTEDAFRLETLSVERKFTAESTAAHSLYEKADPYHLYGPGGHIDLTGCSFTEDERGVTVSGSRFIPEERSTVKLEGARRTGFRTVSIAGVRDPIMIETIDSILDTVRERVSATLKAEGIDGKLIFHIYGKNGVMEELEPESKPGGHELGLVIEGIGRNQDEADSICSIARSTLLHYGYPGRISTAGNLAFPFSPSDLHGGEVYEFSLYHLMESGNDQATLFPLTVIEIDGKETLS